MPSAIGYLVLTVLFETFGTACIQASQQFSRLWPSIGVVIGYGLSFWFLSLALRHVPLGVAYATWSGFGAVNIALVGWFVFGQRLDAPAILGLGLVCSGIAGCISSQAPRRIDAACGLPRGCGNFATCAPLRTRPPRL